MNAKKLVFCTLLLLTTIILTRCGKENVCVAGIGTCATPNTKTTQDSPVTLTLSSDTPTIKINEKATFKAAGGTKPYTFKMYQGQGNLLDYTKTEDSIEFQAIGSAGISAVRVYDAKNNYKTLSITVEE